MEFIEDGKRVRYNPYCMKKDEKIGSGIEVDVYKIGNEVVKFYKRYPSYVKNPNEVKIKLSQENMEKISGIETKRILLPNTILYDKKGNVAGYKMDYIKNLGEESYVELPKEKLIEENKIIEEDLNILSDNNILIEDLLDQNTSYNNGIYIIDPGAFKKDETVNKDICYAKNIELFNHFLIFEVLRGYVLNNVGKTFQESVGISREIFKDYVKESCESVLDYFSEIKSDTLGEEIGKKLK